MDTKKVITIKRTVSEKDQIDVRAGCCSYGQMVDLGRRLDAENEAKDKGKNNEAALVKALIRILHPDVQPAINITNAKYASGVAAAVRFWRERENIKLKYEPSSDEKAAGYEKLAVISGPAGVASTIAEKFGVSGGPNEVFKWEYAQVFMVLLIDFERFKFNKRLADIRDRKRKQTEKSPRGGRR